MTALVGFYKTRAAFGWSILKFSGSNTGLVVVISVRYDIKKLVQMTLQVDPCRFGNFSSNRPSENDNCFVAAD